MHFFFDRGELWEMRILDSFDADALLLTPTSREALKRLAGT